MYHAVYQYVKIKYSDTDEFHVFERVYNEHFMIIQGTAKAGKLKVRGSFKTSLFAFAMGISINFGRIYRLLKGQSGNLIDYFTNFTVLIT